MQSAPNLIVINEFLTNISYTHMGQVTKRLLGDQKRPKAAQIFVTLAISTLKSRRSTQKRLNMVGQQILQQSTLPSPRPGGLGVKSIKLLETQLNPYLLSFFHPSTLLGQQEGREIVLHPATSFLLFHLSPLHLSWSHNYDCSSFLFLLQLSCKKTRVATLGCFSAQ